MLANVYSTDIQRDRRKFFAELGLLRESNTWPWVLIDDFYATRFFSDRKGAINSQGAPNLFNSFVKFYSLIEISLSNRHFTWSNLGEDASLVKLITTFVELEKKRKENFIIIFLYISHRGPLLFIHKFHLL